MRAAELALPLLTLGAPLPEPSRRTARRGPATTFPLPGTGEVMETEARVPFPGQGVEGDRLVSPHRRQPLLRPSLRVYEPSWDCEMSSSPSRPLPRAAQGPTRLSLCPLHPWPMPRGRRAPPRRRDTAQKQRRGTSSGAMPMPRGLSPWPTRGKQHPRVHWVPLRPPESLSQAAQHPSAPAPRAPGMPAGQEIRVQELRRHRIPCATAPTPSSPPQDAAEGATSAKHHSRPGWCPPSCQCSLMPGAQCFGQAAPRRGKRSCGWALPPPRPESAAPSASSSHNCCNRKSHFFLRARPSCRVPLI